MTVDIPLVKRVLQDVIYEARRIPGVEHEGKPVYQIEHVTLAEILRQYAKEAETK